MSKLNQLLKNSFSVALEGIPYAGKVFEILHKMEDQKNFDKLEQISVNNIGQLKEVIAAIESIETRLDNLTSSVRELKDYERDNGFVMLPKLLYHDPAFQHFWLNPEEYGGLKEPLFIANKKNNHFSILMTDMLGEKWVYHIPIQIFGLLLQNQALKGKSEKKALGFDNSSQTHWVTRRTKDILQPKISNHKKTVSVPPKSRKWLTGNRLCESIKQTIAQEVALDPTEIENHTSLTEYGLDDLDFVEAIMDIEEEHGIAIYDFEEQEPLPTIDEVTRVVRKLLEEK